MVNKSKKSYTILDFNLNLIIVLLGLDYEILLFYFYLLKLHFIIYVL